MSGRSVLSDRPMAGVVIQSNLHATVSWELRHLKGTKRSLSTLATAGCDVCVFAVKTNVTAHVGVPTARVYLETMHFEGRGSCDAMHALVKLRHWHLIMYSRHERL